MGRIAAIGELPVVRGWALVGVSVFPADEASVARSAWESLPGDVTVVILTTAAAEQLADKLAGSPSRLSVVMPS